MPRSLLRNAPNAATQTWPNRCSAYSKRECDDPKNFFLSRRQVILFALEQFLKQDLGAGYHRRARVGLRNYSEGLDGPNRMVKAKNPMRNTRLSEKTRRGIHVSRPKKPDAKYTSAGWPAWLFIDANGIHTIPMAKQILHEKEPFMEFKVNCGGCGHPLVHAAPAYPNDLGNCPKCGSELKEISCSLEDTLQIREEFDATGVNPEGDVTVERISRTDGNTTSELSVDAGKDASVTGTRTTRVSNFEEEAVAADALVQARNKKLGTSYGVEKKQKEDSDYADRVLVSTNDAPARIEVQIRHFDTEIIAKLNNKNVKAFKGTRGGVNLAEGIKEAIQEKSLVDRKTKAKAILLLQVPAVVGKMARKQLQRMSFDLMGFKEVWICPFREECFEVFPPLDDDRIAIDAYFNWEKAGRPKGDDKRHWFTAIDRLRGL